MSGWWQTAIADNPILRYEWIPRWLRGRSWRRCVGVVVGLALLAPLVAAGVVRLEHGHLPVFTYIGLGLATVWCPAAILVPGIQLASSVPVWRQNGIWDDLIVSRLRPREIVLGKLMGILLPFWVAGLIVVPPAAVFVKALPNVEMANLLVTFGLTVLLSSAFACLGLFCSMVCASGGSAQLLLAGLALGALMLAGLPGLVGGWMGWTDPSIRDALEWSKLIFLVTPGFGAGGVTFLCFKRLDRRHRH